MSGCSSVEEVGTWDIELHFDERKFDATLKLENENGGFVGSLNSFQFGKIALHNLKITGGQLYAEFKKWGKDYLLKGDFSGDELNGHIYTDDEKSFFIAKKQSDELVIIDRSDINYILPDEDLQETELNIDHAGIIKELNQEAITRGRRIYNSNCINCHGNQDIEGSIPISTRFWEQPFKAGGDPFSMYQTITKGFGLMPPQMSMTPQEKYEVITYIREVLVRNNNEEQYFKGSPG